eukprot:12184435-Heterocapsa_arctica.AAC.1
MPGPKKCDRQVRTAGEQFRQDGSVRQIRRSRPRRQGHALGKAVFGMFCCGWLGSGLEGTANGEWQAQRTFGLGTNA